MMAIKEASLSRHKRLCMTQNIKRDETGRDKKSEFLFFDQKKEQIISETSFAFKFVQNN